MEPLIAYNAALLREPYSGVEVIIDETLRALARHGTLPYRVYLSRGDVRPWPPCDRVRVLADCPAVHSRLRRILWEQAELPRRLRRDGVRVLHAPAYVAPLRARCPVVLTVHDLHVFTHPQYCTLANRLHYRLCMPASIRRAAAIIVYTDHVRRALVARFPETATRISVIPPGVPERFLRRPSATDLEAVRVRYHLPPRFLLFVGDLAPRKNLPGLLAAFQLLMNESMESEPSERNRATGWRSHIAETVQNVWERHPVARKDAVTPNLVIAGAAQGGPDLARLAAREGLAGCMHLPGYVAADDLPALYACADALVCPSFDEGFGLPALEAMASGCPVVCGPGGPAEVCGDAAVLCDPADPASIAAAIRSAQADPAQRAARIAAGLRRAGEFRWERHVAELEALYRAVSEAKR